MAVAWILVLAACADDDSADPGTTEPTSPGATDSSPPPDDPPEEETPDGPRTEFSRIERPLTTDDDAYDGDDISRWFDEVDAAEEVAIASTVADHEQSAIWIPHDRDEPRPLLVVLHSWSFDYRQNMGIPFGRWAQEHGWAMIHPDFGGVNERPQATASDLAVQDVIDAIDFAVDRGDVDPDHVFVTGFSGGGHMALVMAGRHPDRFAGVASWVPIHDLVDWYEFNPGETYLEQIRASCGGDPTTDDDARDECLDRSPVSHLDAAREAGVPIYIGHGIGDDIVPPTHGVRSFNALAEPDDQLSSDEIAAIADNEVPESLLGVIDTDTHFADADPDVLFARRSGSTTLVLFEGGHVGVLNPGLSWMVDRSNER